MSFFVKHTQHAQDAMQASAMRGAVAQRLQRGFTLVETLLALGILVLLTAAVAVAVPVAFKAYKAAVDGSNAQILLSTTSTLLRDEFGLASHVETNSDNTVSYYVSSDGYICSLSQDNGVIKRHVYTGTFDNLQEFSTNRVVPEGATPDGLRAVYDSITYEDGLFRVHDLHVESVDGTTLARIDDAAGNEFDIRSMTVTAQ